MPGREEPGAGAGPLAARIAAEKGARDRPSPDLKVLDTLRAVVSELVPECANLPPYSRAIEKTFGVPVYDVVSLVEWLHAGLRPRGFHAEAS